jgi:hypothetical protein
MLPHPVELGVLIKIGTESCIKLVPLLHPFPLVPIMASSLMTLGLEHRQALERLGISLPFPSYIVVRPTGQLQSREELPLSHRGPFKPPQGLPSGPPLTFLFEHRRRTRNPNKVLLSLLVLFISLILHPLLRANLRIQTWPALLIWGRFV